MRSTRFLRSSRVWSTKAVSGSPSGLFERILGHNGGAIAIQDDHGFYSYKDVKARVSAVSEQLRKLQLKSSYNAPARVGILRTPGTSWISALLGTWNAGHIAVPLSPRYPPAALEQLLEDAHVETVLSEKALSDRLPNGMQVVHELSDSDLEITASDLGLEDAAWNTPRMLLYTSGTTGRPKGVVWREGMIRTHCETLTHSWRWSSEDICICALPLHHVHGIVNVVLSSLYTGARLRMHGAFDAGLVWSDIVDHATIFMGVPTMYRRLIAHYHRAHPERQKELSDAAHHLRLFVCGSAALAPDDAIAWQKIAGTLPLERYGMTETGMTLSNHYEPNQRNPGTLGWLLPGVDAKIGEDGMLLVRGDGVFDEYWQRADATKDAITDGWFETGDVVAFEENRGFVMRGRASTDIIKTGGYKVSALEIEAVARELDDVGDIAVAGIPCADLGERIVAAVELSDGASSKGVEERLNNAFIKALPRYKVPREVVIVSALPRNELGKVQKGKLKAGWNQQYRQEKHVRSGA